MSLKRILYSLLLYLIFPFILLRLLHRSRANPDYRKRWSERLGLAKRLCDKPVIWVHSVSVGEAIAAKPLIEELLNSYTDTPILVTTTTPTGSDRVRAMFAEQIRQRRLSHVYFPYDLLGAVSRFINIFQPQILLVVETEIWPNLYAKCHQKQIPVVMVNARLSAKSSQSYLRFKGLVAETLTKVEVIAVRSKVDAQRFARLGAKQAQIQQIGNIKYDITIDENQLLNANKYLGLWNSHTSYNAPYKRLVYVAASTHKGEDDKVLLIYINLLKQFPDLLLVLVPRHPERFDEVYKAAIEQLPKHINIVRHSQVTDYAEFEKQQLQVILGDSMGEMQTWYATADVVFMGGSLVQTGGHNPLEATLFGVPVLSGPYMFNFEDIATELSAAELLFVCGDEFEISNKLSQLLADKQESRRLGARLDPQSGSQHDPQTDFYKDKAEDFMRQHQGVTRRLLAIVSRLV